MKQGAANDTDTLKTEKDKTQPSKIDATEPQVISKQAAQNISIFLRSSKFSSEQIKRMIISMDDALTEQVDVTSVLQFFIKGAHLETISFSSLEIAFCIPVLSDEV